MTEHEWLTSTDPQAMLNYLVRMPGKAGIMPKAVSIKRQHPLISDRQCRLLAYNWAIRSGTSRGKDWWDKRNHKWVLGLPEEDEVNGSPLLAAQSWAANEGDLSQADKADILRDIVGNPREPVRSSELRCPNGHKRSHVPMGDQLICKDCYKPVDYWLHPWITSPTVQRIAQAIHDNGTYEDLPILWDALEEAGCENEEIRRHCMSQERCPNCCGEGEHSEKNYHGAWDSWGCQKCGGDFVKKGTKFIPMRGPHVRGCWVVDLILRSNG